MSIHIQVHKSVLSLPAFTRKKDVASFIWTGNVTKQPEMPLIGFSVSYCTKHGIGNNGQRELLLWMNYKLQIITLNRKKKNKKKWHYQND